MLLKYYVHSSFIALSILHGINIAYADNITQANKSINTSTAEVLLPMDVLINGVKSGTWLFIERSDDLYVQRDAFSDWRILVNADSKVFKFKGQDYLPLSSVPGFKYKIDFPNQSVSIAFSPQSFTETTISEALASKLAPSPVLSSVFLNYDINYAKSYARLQRPVEDLSALTEFGASSEWGVLTTSSSIRNLTNDIGLGKGSDIVRLETTFTKDFSDSNRSLWIGDTITPTGMLGRNVYFGGIRYGTNFGLTPGYVSQPLPSIAGLSASPSTVELYVNDVLRKTSTVPAGPFAINNFPNLTGSGDVRVVVRDLLGRETVIQQSFFTNGQLLAPELNDWSVEAGLVRKNLGSFNADYTSEFISGLWRRGLDKNLTIEGRTAITSNLDVVEMGLVSKIPFNALGRVALAVSRDDALSNGNQWLLSVERQNARFSAYFQAQGANQSFRDLGQEYSMRPIKLQLSGNLSYTESNLGTLSFGFAKIDQYESPSVTTLSGNYSVRMGQNASFIANVSEAITGGMTSTSVGFSLSVSLDKNRIVGAYVNKSGKNTDLYTTYNQSPYQDEHAGFHALMGQQQSQFHDEVGGYYVGNYGNLSAELSASSALNAMRLGGNGGLILTEGHVYATQRLISSFVLAEVKDYPNVGVGIGNNFMAKTGRTGLALIPNLSPYQKNSILLNAQDLPISAEIESIEVDVVPKFRSGVKINFPVRKGRGALLKINLENGAPAPSGATVHIQSDKEEFYVARRGEAFVTGMQTNNHLMLNWDNKQCQFDVTLPAEDMNEIPRLGPFMCKEIKNEN